MGEKSQFSLLRERRFGPFFGVQFLGALNDNVFKQALVILLAYQTASFTALSSDTLQNLAQALFVAPFFLFSATAGQIADKLEKSRLITVTVAIELGCMALGFAGLVAKSLPLLLAALFLGGVQSTLFGPVKYAILPQHLREAELVGGNGLVESGTSVAILAGMMLGGWMVTQPGWGVAGVGLATMAISASGIVLSRFIPLAPPAEPRLAIDWNPVSATWKNLAFARASRTVFLSVLGVSWFWFYGSLLVTQFPNLAKNVLGGAAADGQLGARLLFDLFGLGLFGGFYIVPLYALIQTRSEVSHRSRIIAANNILNALFMVAAALIAIALLAAGLSIPQLLVIAALMNAAVALYIYKLVPEFLMRFMVWLLIHSVYRLEKRGLDAIPEEGPAVLVCNHVSFVDALVISAACRRPIRWVMYYKIFQIPLLSFFFRTVRAVPIAGAKEDPQMLERAFDAIAAELAAGDLVGVFPEGKLTTDGDIDAFRAGITKILERTPVPVVPMALSGLWRSLFARNGLRGGDKLRHLRHLFPRVRLSVGAPLAPAAATPEALHAAVLELRGPWR